MADSQYRTAASSSFLFSCTDVILQSIRYIVNLLFGFFVANGVVLQILVELASSREAQVHRLHVHILHYAVDVRSIFSSRVILWCNVEWFDLVAALALFCVLLLVGL